MMDSSSPSKEKGGRGRKINRLVITPVLISREAFYPPWPIKIGVWEERDRENENENEYESVCVYGAHGRETPKHLPETTYYYFHSNYITFLLLDKLTTIISHPPVKLLP